MRIAFATAILVLAACSPLPPMPEPATESDAAGGPDPYLAEQLDSSRAATGQWTSRIEADVQSACFGAVPSQCQLRVQCEAATKTLTVAFAYELAPDQDAVIEIHTDQTSVSLFSSSYNEGQPNVTAVEPPDGLDRLGLIETLSPSPARFGVEAHSLQSVGSDIIVFPWDESLTRIVAACSD